MYSYYAMIFMFCIYVRISLLLRYQVEKIRGDLVIVVCVETMFVFTIFTSLIHLFPFF